ncbi:MAG TPA: hypothetical protein P5121_19455 [Caldilineaceae bacterium]|nr:hypothetical protein [Caldilineaceae bacterium]
MINRQFLTRAYRLVPPLAALLLALAGLTFPIGRIPDSTPVYIVTDTAFVIALFWIGWRSLGQAAADHEYPNRGKLRFSSQPYYCTKRVTSWRSWV